MQTLIIGAGGAGCNIVSQLPNNDQFTTALFNTDLEFLQKYLNKDARQLGKQVCQGNTPLNYIQAQKAVDESRVEIQQLIQPFTSIRLVAGLGGNTGTAFTQTLIELVQQTDKALELFLITPLKMEANRLKLANQVLAEISEQHHKNIYSLEEHFKDADKKETFESFLKKVDELVISGLINK